MYMYIVGVCANLAVTSASVPSSLYDPKRMCAYSEAQGGGGSEMLMFMSYIVRRRPDLSCACAGTYFACIIISGQSNLFVTTAIFIYIYICYMHLYTLYCYMYVAILHIATTK